MSASVSVIIVSYYTGPTLELAIASALIQPECKEIILVNNGNAPGDEARLHALANREPRITFIDGLGNVGFGKGCNIGASKATGDYFLLLNPDSMLPPDVLANMLQEMSNYPRNTLAGCYLINPDGSEQRGGRRSILTPTNAIVEALGVSKFYNNADKLNFNDSPVPEDTHELPAISGAFMMIAAEFYKSLGGFDESYFLHMEDMDFCYRVHQAGGKVICVPGAKVMHFRSTSEVSSAFIEKQKAKGFIKYLRKYFSAEHSELFFKIMHAGIYARSYLKIIISRLNNIFVPPMTARNEIAAIALLHRLTKFSHNDTSLVGKTIIVTGANSEIGLSVVGKALARGAKVIAVYKRKSVEFNHANLQWHNIYLSDKSEIEAFAGIKAAAVIHVDNINLLPDLLPKFLAAGIKRIIAFNEERIFELGESLSEPIQQNLLKEASEKLQHLTILCPNFSYGAGFASNITKMADVIRRFGRLPIYGEAAGLRNPVNVMDLADAALAIVENPETYGKVYYLGGSQALSYCEMVVRLFEYLGKAPRLMKIPYFPHLLNLLGKLYQIKDINSEIALRMNVDLLCDNTAATQDFGYNSGGFLEGDMVI